VNDLEYFIGSAVTLITIWFFAFLNKVFKTYSYSVKIKASQSRTHYLMMPVTINIAPRKDLVTQATNHFDNSQVRVLMTETNAYWISNNALQVADIVDGQVVQDSAKRVDMMGMDKVELEEMIFIVEKLTEGKSNDSWSSGN
jgi:hypothetical protein